MSINTPSVPTPPSLHSFIHPASHFPSLPPSPSVRFPPRLNGSPRLEIYAAFCFSTSPFPHSFGCPSTPSFFFIPPSCTPIPAVDFFRGADDRMEVLDLCHSPLSFLHSFVYRIVPSFLFRSSLLVYSLLGPDNPAQRQSWDLSRPPPLLPFSFPYSTRPSVPSSVICLILSSAF